MAISIQTTQYNLIYVYSRKEIPDAIKIGKASINEPESVRDSLTPNCEKLNVAAIECIKGQTQRTGADFTLLYTELAWFENSKGEGSKFMDTDVHDVLIHSGFKRKVFDSEVINPTEWFKVDLPTVIKAIAAIKNEQEVIEGPQVIEKPKKDIRFREEQEKAINATISHYEIGRQMLWNAKMRFGKTLCALELIRRKEYGRVLILTHRPAVRSGWFEDYHNLKFVNQQYGSKGGDKYAFCDENDTKGKNFETLEKDFKEKGIHYIYFASMQDLRGSQIVADKGINKNDDVFKTDWDLIILDEAHEGTETPLGQNVIKGFCEERNPYLLYLSGTPFNILYHFSEDEIYTWDYVMEQDAKDNWSIQHPNEPNPYEGLARLNIYTYDLGDVFETNAYTRTEDDFFNFAEFFRVWTGNERIDGAPMPTPNSKGKFVHEVHVRKFLDMLCDKSTGSKYPYSTNAFRDALSHTLWMLPGVDAALALEKLIQNHRLSKEFNFTTINVAGEGSKIEGLDEDDAKKIEKLGSDVLQKVKSVIKIKPRTITLSCGRLTTGVSVPEWTGVFMLRGGFNVDAGNYMQTIFRGQTPFKNGAIKTNCYAFDFAPDRTLTVIDDYVEKQPNASGSHHTKGEKTANLLRLCPVIAMKGGQEVEYDAHSFIDEVNKAYKEHVIRNGFKGRMLHKNFADFTDSDHALLAEIGKVFDGNKVKTTSDGRVKMSDSGLTGEKSSKSKKGTKKKEVLPSKQKSYSKEEADRRKKSQNVLDQIFVRLPLLLFGAVEDTSHLTISELVDDVIDEPSWHVFMPEGFKKPMFKQIAHLVREDLLISCTAEIIKMAQKADELTVEERVKEIARMLSTFHYPDHETVLTPWRVVNMHLGSTIGGYNFYDENYRTLVSEPRWDEKGEITSRVFKAEDTQILEINSKSGVYPLYLTYTLWRVKRNQQHPKSKAEELAIWDSILSDNVFVLCQTEMAKKITERVLRGYRDVHTHCCVYKKLVETLRLKESGKNNEMKKQLVNTIKSTKFWNINNGSKYMKFNAVVSNPPYQAGVNKEPLYHLFIDLGRELGDLGTIIHPGRFLFNAGKTPKKWNEKMLNDQHYKVVNYWTKSSDVFDNVDIKGGVAITMWDSLVQYKPIGTFILQDELREIKELVWSIATDNFCNNVYSRDLYQLKEIFYTENPKLDNRQSEGHRFDVGTTFFSLFPEVFFDNKEDDCSYALIVGRENDTRIAKWIKSKYLKLPDNFNSYKVFIPKANGSGLFGEALGEPIIGEPRYGHNTTFLSVGNFATFGEANACLKYLKTKFARTMLGIRKVTQESSKRVWEFVPNQDFTSNSDINWSLSIPEIDQQLYRKYKLQDYIEFIEETVKPME
ncbi:Eco57I restriction-modification methylase domain-containing protein [Bacteroides caecigallinarum]|uniref:Eco57I restriction-modification methylase domain-containing protein n=1 Tax=Bacteroides caecigallinarum TaxID=1411144 RepID=UPI001956A227|nr:Eco57I restriction-modification methylase domain-containing protein [Bacteroides caecigallinarum]MBM6881723.1 Eco57I restriction-modification methylase domain-containing protein [Bacteroides caecigallinarum]